MLEKSFGLLFFLKQTRNYTGGEMYIYLRITVNGISKEISTKRLCHPKKWDSRSGRAIGNNEDAKSLNKLIETLNLKAYEAKRALVEDNKEITAQAIKNLLLGVDESRTVMEVFQQHNEQMEKLIPAEYSIGTLDLFKRSMDHTKSFMVWKYGVSDLELKKLDFDFINQFSFYLKSERKCQHNTTIKYLTYFKKIVLICVKNGWLSRDPFILFKLTKREVERDYLTQDELDSMIQKSFSTERLVQVRDVFIFSCYTGLAYADVLKLKRSEIVGINQDDLWVKINRQKTSTASKIPLLPVPNNIIQKYKEHPQCIIKGTLLPILTNQKMNSYLKEIADVCGITKNLTFHIARHTFATTVTLNNGVPIESVSKMLGHKNLRQTQHYAKLLDKKVGEDMQNLRIKLNQNR